MSADAGLAAPGSSIYSSNSMHVGDGTWDASRNSFLLPNIQGLNFATMRYNGMGNRFRALPEYHTLIIGHGVLAAITFLFIVPAAIFTTKFYHRDSFLALRVHITLQIFTVILATVVLVLGYFAVGSERSLTNPHHGIGVAIYTLVLFQAIGGWLVHKIEFGKTRYYAPMKLMLHKWIGRAIALLAVAQIPIGLTLYGSPEYLFILYTLVVFGYVVLYFLLTFQQNKRHGIGAYDERGSYVSGTQYTDENGRRRNSGRLGALTGAVAGGLGVAALRNRFSNRSRRERDDDPQSAVGHSRMDSGSYLTEKYSDDGATRDHTWRNRILGVTAGVGGVAAARKFFGRKREEEDVGSDVSAYRPPLGGPVTSSTMNVNRIDEHYHGPTETDEERWRRVEEGEAPQAIGATSDLRPSRRREDSIGEYSEEGIHNQNERRGVAGGLAVMAGAVGLGGWLQRRRSKKEQERVDAQRQQEAEEERMYRTQEQQPLYPGGNAPRPGAGGVRFDPNLPGSASRNQFDGQSTTVQGAPRPSGPFPVPYGVQPPLINIPPPPTNGPPRSRLPLVDQGNLPLAPPPPQHTSPYSSVGGSPMSGTQHARTGPYIAANAPATLSNTNTGRSPLTGPPITQYAELQQPPPVASPPRARRSSNATNPSNYSSLPNSPPGGDEQSPAVSVRVKQHPDGRHVTVQRLNSEEAARRRAQQQQGGQSRRGSSADGPPRVPAVGPSGSTPNVSSPLRANPPYPRWSAESAPAYGQQQGAPAGPQAQNPQVSEMHLPGTQPGLGSSSSAPGGGASEYEANRRRRRAERLRVEAARQGNGQGTGPPTGAGQTRFDFN